MYILSPKYFSLFYFAHPFPTDGIAGSIEEDSTWLLFLIILIDTL